MYVYVYMHVWVVVVVIIDGYDDGKEEGDNNMLMDYDEASSTTLIYPPALMRLGRPSVSALTTRCDLMYFTASFEARR